MVDGLITLSVAVPQDPTHLFTPVGFVQKPVLPFGAQHFALDGIDDAHGDEEVVPVGAEGLAGALEAAGGGARCWGGAGVGVRGVQVGHVCGVEEGDIAYIRQCVAGVMVLGETNHGLPSYSAGAAVV